MGAGVPPVEGFCDPRFEPVRRAFEANFRDHDELGACVAVMVDGRPVADLWAGWANAEKTRRWERDTLVNVFSIGKALTALCLHLLVDRDAIDVYAPVARYWEEFGAAGKERVTVRELLGHRAGLPAVRRALPPFAMYDWERMTSALAAQVPWWEPGTAHGYHVNTFGFLVGELVRRVDGRRIGAFFREEVAKPLAVDCHFGIGSEHDARIADYQMGGGSLQAILPDAEVTDERRLMVQRAYANPQGLSGNGTVNTRAWRACEYPSTSGHSNARAVARIYAALAAGGELDGVRLLAPETLERAVGEVSCGVDRILLRPSRFGLGFQLTQPERPLGPHPRSFGHFGAGGSLGFADPDARLGFAYAMNRPGPRWQNPRNRALIEAVYASLS